MKHIGIKFALVVLLTLGALVYVIPFQKLGITLPFSTPEYKLGLDLHGGVELDYKIDFADLDARGQQYVERDVTEWLKSIVEKRVNSLGTAEPTITTAQYGDESHIIVQLPTQDFKSESLTEAQIQAKNAEYIKNAKDTIGKVVRLEFKERKTTITEEDRTERKNIADNARAEAEKSNAFTDTAKRVTQAYENTFYLTGTSVEEAKLPLELSFPWFTSLTATGLTRVIEGEIAGAYEVTTDWQLKQGEPEKIFVVAQVTDIKKVTKEREVADTWSGAEATGSGATKTETYETQEWTYEALIVSQRPSVWTPAKTTDGKVLDEKFLSRAGVSFNQGFTPQIDLIFNDEGKTIFAELTKRLVGKELAIYVGGELLTAPTIQAVIPDGHAVITGSYTAESAKKLANDINTGIVPAPIYLTSERAIDAKIGSNALTVIVQAGAIGLIAIILFLTICYRVSGLLAGIALVIYAILLVAIFKVFGIVLTLASIAGMILSIGLAIDANILIFERTKEALRDGADITKSTTLGFNKSWTAIWDSHVTSLTSAVVLYVFGTSLIKGFGLALGIGIILSLFTAMWVSRVLVIMIGNRFIWKEKLFIGQKRG